MAMQCSSSSSSGTKTPEVESNVPRFYHVRNTFLHLAADEQDYTLIERKIRSCPVSRIGSGDGFNKDPIARDVEVLVASTRSTVYDSADNSSAHSLDGDGSPELLNEKVMFSLLSSLESTSSSSRSGRTVPGNTTDQAPRTASTRFRELAELQHQRRQQRHYTGIVASSDVEEEPIHVHIPSSPVQIESMLTHWQGFDMMICQLHSQGSARGKESKHVHFEAEDIAFDVDFGLAPPAPVLEANACDKNAALKAAAPWRLKQERKTATVLDESCVDLEPSISDEEHDQDCQNENLQQTHVSPHYSLGSVGHEAGTCRPCAFLYTKGCANGIDCEFCHLCEPDEKKKRRKEKLEVQRQFRKQRREFTRSYRAY
jgi:hypothetical protein